LQFNTETIKSARVTEVKCEQYRAQRNNRRKRTANCTRMSPMSH